MLKNWFSPPGEWSLHHPMKGWTLHSLSLREARLIISTFSPPESKSALAWKPGWKRWQKLEAAESASLREGLPVVKSDAPPVTIPENGDTVMRKPTILTNREPRTFRRLTAIFPVEILSGSNRFSTETVDLSEGGMRFKERLPDWVAGYFTVIIKMPERHFEVTCMLVEDQKTEKTRVEAVETDDEESHLPAYKEWVRLRLPPA